MLILVHLPIFIKCTLVYLVVDVWVYVTVSIILGLSVRKKPEVGVVVKCFGTKTFEPTDILEQELNSI